MAKGMQCTRDDEKRLKQMQLKQVQESKNIEMQQHDIDMMWHQVLLADVRDKEHQERIAENRRQQEMLDRRRAYDEQIASANRKRQEAIREERGKENRRIERMKKKMEQDHYDAIKKKKDQQNKNKTNYIEGHELKLKMLREEKMKAREIDDGTIRVALEDLERERQKNIRQMRNLQLEKRIFVENYNRERRMALALEEEADKISQQWKRDAEQKADEQYRKLETEKRVTKEQAAHEYNKHLSKIDQEVSLAKKDRLRKMEQVKRTAYLELEKKLDGAKEELVKQIEHRHILTNQIRENEKYHERQHLNTEIKDRPFTKKAIMFREAVENTLKQKNVVRDSTNPVHPFMYHIIKEENRIQLPLI